MVVSNSFQVLIDFFFLFSRQELRFLSIRSTQGLIYEEIRSVLKQFLETIIRDAVVYTEHARRRTVQPVDIICALRRNNRTLYGFGTYV